MASDLDLSERDDHGERMAACRRAARWELGDESWADMFLQAYQQPDDANAYLDEKGAPE